jgi:hypothetical protein
MSYRPEKQSKLQYIFSDISVFNKNSLRSGTLKNPDISVKGVGR